MLVSLCNTNGSVNKITSSIDKLVRGETTVILELSSHIKAGVNEKFDYHRKNASMYCQLQGSMCSDKTEHMRILVTTGVYSGQSVLQHLIFVIDLFSDVSYQINPFSFDAFDA